MASPKILLVEDNFVTADEISDRLRQLGFSNIELAFSGAGAVKLAETEQPDLILMDIHLGAGMDGIEAAAQIQAGRRAPVIYLTAYDNDATLARAKISDPSAYLIKPVRERELQIAIEIALYKQQAEAAIRQSEERFRAVFEQAAAGIAIVTPDERLIEVNQKLCDMLGYTRDELLRLTVQDITFPDDREREQRQTREVLAGKRDAFGLEKRYRHKDGHLVWAHLSSNAARDEQGGIDYVIGVVVDISEQKQVEQALRDSEARLREANATKDRFFSIIAHDLKNPVHSFEAGARMLKERLQGSEDEQTLTLARELHEAAERVSKLLENLLTWARVQQDSISYQPVATGLAARVRFCAGLAQQWAEQKQITICNRVPADLMVRADDHMLAAILRNLLSNAVKFTNPGGLVTIEAAPQDGMVEIAVTDTGVGMSQEKAAGIFDIREKGNTGRGTAGERGTGLGLLLCLEFVLKHGGRIWVESEPGQGSAFRFTLPRAEAAASAKRNLTGSRGSTT